MKKIFLVLLCLVTLVAFGGCGEEKSSQIPNPWSDWKTLEEAEADIGYQLGISEAIDDKYMASQFRTMKEDSPLLEVIYEGDDSTVTVRKAPGEDQDISGVYGYNYIKVEEGNDSTDGREIACRYESEENANQSSSVVFTFSYDGYSWSIFAEDGLSDEDQDDFIQAIFD